MGSGRLNQTFNDMLKDIANEPHVLKRFRDDAKTIRKILENPDENSLKKVYDILKSALEPKELNLMTSRRKVYCEVYGWSIMKHGLIKFIANNCCDLGIQNVVHIACGFDLAGALLRAEPCGLKVFSSDLMKTHGSEKKDGVEFGPISRVDAEDAVKDNVTHENASITALMSIWPSYEEDFAYRALVAYRKLGGKVFIFIGEGSDGCTGDEQLFKELSENWTEKIYTCISQWYGINDYARIYVRNDE